MSTTPLRRKLALAYMGLIAAVLALAGFFLLNYISNVFVESLSRDLAIRAQLIRDSVAAAWGWPDNAAGDQAAQAWASLGQARVTVIGLDGRVLAESEEPSAAMVNHADRPEFQAALAGGVGFSRRYSETRRERMLYAAVPLRGAGEVAAVVRLAISLEWVWARIAAIRTGLGVALGGGLLLAGLIGMWLGGRMLTEPLSRVVRGAQRFVAGDLKSPIDIRTGDEWELLAAALNDMAASLDRQVSDLAAERTRVRDTLEGLPDGVLLLSPRGKLQIANQRARHWLSLPAYLGEYKPDAAGGEAVAPARDTVQLLGRTPDLRAFVRRALAARTDQNGEFSMRGPLASRLDVRSRWGGEPGASDLLIVFHDISEIRRLESARRDLVANVSHELKTPIGAIRVLAETLASDPEKDPALLADLLGRIIRETERLNGLVEEMLYLSRLESAVDGLDVVEADLGDIVDQAVQGVRPLGGEKGVEIEIQRGGDTMLRCDPERIERAARALMENAIRFSPRGAKIRVSTAAQDDELEFTVDDEGPGIPSEALPRVFERFFKVEQSRRGPGSGLGLAIVKHVVQSHGGRVFARSELGHGSTFGFALPRRDG